MAEMTSFCIYMDWEEQLSGLTDEERGIIFSAIFQYKRTGEIPPLPRILSLVFSFIRQQLDRDAEKYESKIQKRRQAGRQGGRPSQNSDIENKSNKAEKQDKAKKANGFPKKQNKAKKADTDTDTDTVTGTVTDTNTEYTSYTDTEHTDVCSTQANPFGLPSLILNDGSQHIISSSELEEYKALYPAIDVEQQVRNMAGWLKANPKNRKTKTGIRRFISSWLSREQNKAPPLKVPKDFSISYKHKKSGLDVDLDDIFELPSKV